MSDNSSRVKQLNSANGPGKCVLYVMSRDQRTHDNHALLAAQARALQAGLPLAVVFCLLPKTGVRAREHYEFMLKGLKQVESELKKHNIPFMMVLGDAYERLSGVFYHVQPFAVYFDFNPLRGPIALQAKLAANASFAVYVVDTHNVVPVWIASPKLEVGARTLRPKIHRLLAEYVHEPPKLQKHPYDWRGPIISLTDLKDKIYEVVAAQTSNCTASEWLSGQNAANIALQEFLAKRLQNYATDRNDPSKDGLSDLSPYLHFGQLSSLRVALELQQITTAQPVNSELQESAAALLEEMIVRKELSDNWCYYNQNYDNLRGVAQWAQNTLNKHINDPREFIYTPLQFSGAQTHDPAWNAAQKQLITTGKMHGYMRMYWAKKVLEWSPSPQEAITTLVYLNDFYSIDGGDPNGYVGIMWSVAGVHDRPWGERAVYGTIRCMVYGGLKRKFDIVAYQNKYL